MTISKPVKSIIPPPPYAPPPWDVADAAALQALAKGQATELQQQRALNWIIYQATATYDLEYRPDSRDHAFASGRRFAGLEIVKLLKINTATFSKTKGE
jgi:hypothetical protein